MYKPPEDLPDVASTIGPVLASLERERRPLLVALAERLAADRYREWAAEAELAPHAEGLRTCAAREEEIARRVESLFPDAAATQAKLQAELPQVQEMSQKLFERPLLDQLAMQAGGERVGAATWRAFAKGDPASAETYLACAELEEASAEFLESVLAAAP